MIKEEVKKIHQEKFLSRLKIMNDCLQGAFLSAECGDEIEGRFLG
jgi:hypothetical protein